VHCDYDDWGEYYNLLGQAFVQGDAHQLTDYFPTNSFEMVLMGDILEHLPDPYKACDEAAKVTSRYLCMTVWEEWRGPGGDEQIKWAQEKYLEECAEKDYAASLFGGQYCRISDDMVLSHWGHCQKFTDEYIEDLVDHLCKEHGMTHKGLYKVMEVIHEGHECFNWLILLEKTGEV
jgi:ubiquinone/menaquinone biosynthesis C-methylase UbiE